MLSSSDADEENSSDGGLETSESGVSSLEKGTSSHKNSKDIDLVEFLYVNTFGGDDHYKEEEESGLSDLFSDDDNETDVRNAGDQTVSHFSRCSPSASDQSHRGHNDRESFIHPMNLPNYNNNYNNDNNNRNFHSSEPQENNRFNCNTTNLGFEFDLETDQPT
jgi:hypothetical protein